MKLRAKYFFLEEVSFLTGANLDLDKYILPWQICFIVGCLTLESSCVWVNIVSIK